MHHPQAFRQTKVAAVVATVHSTVNTEEQCSSADFLLQPAGHLSGCEMARLQAP